ncbi:MAG TPA: regulator [Gammaproteobacteria bacterium]|nr:regulator [Gammaproteobacteria bacterium]
MRSSFLPLCLLAFSLAACSGKDEPGGETAAPATLPTAGERAAAPAALPRLLETFQVGKGVYVRSLAVDEASGALWVGTSLGVHEVDLASRELRRTLTRKEGLANEYVFAIYVDSRGDKWFGTNGGGMSRYRDGGWRTYFPLHGLADYWVYAFTEGPDGALWIGTWYGVSRLDPRREHFVTYRDELVNEWVYGVDVDSRGRVWFGTEGGISMFDGRSWHSWTHADGLGAPNREGLPPSTNTGLGTRSRHDLSVLSQGKPTYNPNYVFSVLVADDDTVWAGTWGGGVSRFDGHKWHNLTRREGLAGDIVYSIAQDSDGVLWFGTNGGLSRYDGRHWHNYGRADGLGDENIYAVAATSGGDVWVGTRGEVARFGRGGSPAGASSQR